MRESHSWSKANAAFWFGTCGRSRNHQSVLLSEARVNVNVNSNAGDIQVPFGIDVWEGKGRKPQMLLPMDTRQPKSTCGQPEDFVSKCQNYPFWIHKVDWNTLLFSLSNAYGISWRYFSPPLLKMERGKRGERGALE